MKYALINDGSQADVKAFPLLAQGLLQFMRMFAVDWRRDPSAMDVQVFDSTVTAPQGWARTLVKQTLDVDGALAYHDRDENGNPIIYCGFGLVPNGELFHGPSGDGASLMGELQHECAEAEADESANYWVDLDIIDPQDPSKKYHSVALEVEDPVQETSSPMDIGGTKMDCTNYVTPAWFNPQTPKGVRVDRLNSLAGPGLIAPGGYAIVRRTFTQDSQIFAEAIRLDHHVPMRMWRAQKKVHPRSRTMRRLGVKKLG